MKSEKLAIAREQERTVVASLIDPATTETAKAMSERWNLAAEHFTDPEMRDNFDVFRQNGAAVFNGLLGGESVANFSTGDGAAIESIIREMSIKAGDAWSDYLLRPQGIVGDVADWITKSSGMYQPKFALAASLAACAALIGRGVRDYTGQRSNIYVLAVGNTSAGKNAPLKCVDLLFRELKRQKALQGEVTSDSALEILLSQFPVRLLMLDEIGHYFANVKSAGMSNGFLKTVMPMFTKAWSAADGTIYGKTRAEDKNGKWRPGQAIHEPCLCIYGTTVPSILFQAMSEEDLSDGSIPRFICFISKTRPKFEAKAEAMLTESLKCKICDALNKLGIPPHGAKTQDGKPADVPTPLRIPESPEAANVFKAFEDEKTSHMTEADNGDVVQYLWGKTGENARRIALTVAAMRNPANPMVDGYDAKYAVDLMTVLTSEFVAYAKTGITSDKIMRYKNKILDLVRSAGKNGVTKSLITRRTRYLRPSERDDLIFDLIVGGEIKEVKDASKFAPMYTLAEED